jgi:DNA-binding GntR family transcriptional regulator
LRPLETRSIPESVYEALLNAIVSGKIVPGERIFLREVASQLQVSIMPVREALRKLEAEKFVQRSRSRSVFAAELSAENLREITQIRILIEGYAATKAVETVDNTIVETLENIHTKILKVKDVEEYLRLNRQFHHTIYQQANLPTLYDIINSLWERISPYLHILHYQDKHWPPDSVVRDHRGMLDSIKRKDPVGIKHFLSSDLSDSADRVIEMIEARRHTAGQLKNDL